MAWSLKRNSRCRSALESHTGQAHILREFAGPAHAVYFATYEAVKQGMGGNEGTEHHPLAAGAPVQDFLPPHCRLTLKQQRAVRAQLLPAMR